MSKGRLTRFKNSVGAFVTRPERASNLRPSKIRTTEHTTEQPQQIQQLKDAMAGKNEQWRPTLFSRAANPCLEKDGQLASGDIDPPAL